MKRFSLLIAFGLIQLLSLQAQADVSCGYVISVAQSPEANEFTNDSEAVKVNSITEHRKIWIYSDTTLGAKKLLEQATSLSGKKVCVFFIRELGELGRLNDNTYTGQVDHVFEDSEEGWKSHNSWVQGE